MTSKRTITRNREIADALLIKKRKLFLNVQEKRVKLELFNLHNFARFLPLTLELTEN